METIVIFGCGTGGQRARRHLASRFRIIAFLDNDRTRQGTRVCGIPVQDPSKYDFGRIDRVFIASMYLDQILVQLFELEVPAAKIEYMSNDLLTGNTTLQTTDLPTIGRTARLLRRAFFLPFRLVR